MVTQIKEAEARERAGSRRKGQDARWDTFSEWTNFQAVVTKLNELLLDEDPVLAQKMGVVPSELNENTDFGVGTMEADSEEKGLEAQIQMYCEKFTKEQDERVGLKLQEQKGQMEKRMDVGFEKKGAVFDAHLSELNEYIGQVHQ